MAEGWPYPKGVALRCIAAFLEAADRGDPRLTDQDIENARRFREALAELEAVDGF